MSGKQRIAFISLLGSVLCSLLLTLVLVPTLAGENHKSRARKTAADLHRRGDAVRRPEPAKNEGSSKEKTLTYAKDISPIIMNRCANCHQSNGIAPFSLTNYQDVKKRASTIDAVVAAKVMPPWKPSLNYGEFENERCLSAEETASIHNWIKQGAVAGDLSQAAQLDKSKLISDEWRGGKPDLIIRMPEPYKVASDGPDVYRCFVFPLGMVDHRFVSHVEFHPGNPKVVHHALFFLDNQGEARKKDAADPGPGFTSFGGPGFLPTGALGGWAPGNRMLPLPDGVARLARKNSDLVMQLHFHPNGKEELAQAELGIYFSKSAPKTLLLPLTVRSRKIDIPPGEKNYVLTTNMTVPNDFNLLQVAPHGHLLCREIQCHATTPSGEEIPLIWIKNWDFNWQEQYAYKKPIHLPRGTVVKAKFVYDNSEDNFRNPNHPPKRVTWGEETTDEMALIFFGGTVSRNEEMPDYMRSMLTGTVKDLPGMGANPIQIFNAMRSMLGDENNPLKILQKAQSQEK